MRSPFSLCALAAFAIMLAPISTSAAAVPVASVESAGGATIVSQPDSAATLVGIAFVVRAGLDRQTLRENGLAALVAQTIVRTPVVLRARGGGGMPLEDAIAARGGSIRFTVDPSDVRFYIEALAADAPAVLDLFRSAVAAPDFSAATVREARSTLVRQIAQTQQIALQVGLDMLNAASGRKRTRGCRSLGTPNSLAQVFSGDARSFYQRYYKRGGALVSAAGRLDALPSGALAALASALPEGTTAPVTVRTPALSGATHEIVAHRDIASPWLIAQYPAPKVDSRDFGPMLVLSGLHPPHAFGYRASSGRRLADVRLAFGRRRLRLRSRAVEPVLYVNGGLNGNPSRAFATALSVVNVLAATRLQGSIEEFKAEAAGDFANDATTLETRTWLAAVFSRDSSSPDFINRALQAIAATTPDDIQRVARTYLGNPMIALVLPRGTNLQD